MLFHWVDTMDYFPQYRLHTPAEVAKRNRVTRWQVVRDVVIQQVVQTAVGWVLGMTEPDDFYGKEQYDVTAWARRIRLAQRAIPGLLGVVGLDAVRLAQSLGATYPTLAGVLAGGQYKSIEDFVGWEISLAWTFYWLLVPLLQFSLGILVVDTWQYFLHRAMHMNKWLYSRCS